ncbi:hypothetical protein GTC6_19548 [Gordonia terrae C-6]|uniref:Uncharacterized protein n=1 Tax=Gordonia terrae C-6 TaxID=1316928 RepID=R7Y4W0_9ACTN|nr:hypothetical protein [Gordonia terrae]EON31071.1 hypothetical protein GTC6_19548 [Gordonia terrae C-6]
MTGFDAAGFGRRTGARSSLGTLFAAVRCRVDVDLLAAGAALHPEAPPLGLPLETARTVGRGQPS